MRNTIILGSGRSGTSMVAGTLAKSGYFMGEKLVLPREANPKGFFEALEINKINEDILAPIVPKRLFFPSIKWLNLPERTFFRHRPVQWQMWLASIPLTTKIPASVKITERIKKMVQEEPYCFKDPRFSYTLPIWKPHLKKTVFICVFRDPASTALSILKECSTASYLNDEKKGIKLSWKQIIQIWTLMYEHILQQYNQDEEWLFIHYNQALTSEGLEQIANFTGAEIDRSFPDRKIRKSFSNKPFSKKALKTYQKLCSLANYTEPS